MGKDTWEKLVTYLGSTLQQLTSLEGHVKTLAGLNRDALHRIGGVTSKGDTLNVLENLKNHDYDLRDAKKVLERLLKAGRRRMAETQLPTLSAPVPELSGTIVTVG